MLARLCFDPHWQRETERRSLARLGFHPEPPAVDPSERLSRGIGGGPRLIGATAGENGPGDAGELVGEHDRQHVAVEPLRRLPLAHPDLRHRGRKPCFDDATLANYDTGLCELGHGQWRSLHSPLKRTGESSV